MEASGKAPVIRVGAHMMQAMIAWLPAAVSNRQLLRFPAVMTQFAELVA
jgi:hypothetical protein